VTPTIQLLLPLEAVAMISVRDMAAGHTRLDAVMSKEFPCGDGQFFRVALAIACGIAAPGATGSYCRDWRVGFGATDGGTRM